MGKTLEKREIWTSRLEQGKSTANTGLNKMEENLTPPLSVELPPSRVSSHSVSHLIVFISSVRQRTADGQ